MLKCKRVFITNNDLTLLDISFSLKNSMAIVGHSGSGKSLTLKAILGLLSKNLKCEIDISTDFEFILGKSVAFIPQNPFTALSPMTKVSKQFFAPFHKMVECMEMVSLDKRFLQRFPSELSGGQLQRVIIAMALAQEPKLILLDEPTTALDFDSKEKIIALLEELHKKVGFSMLFVTHELPLAKRLCEECIVLKEGRVVERGASVEIFNNPAHIYTKALIEVGFEKRSFRI